MNDDKNLIVAVMAVQHLNALPSEVLEAAAIWAATPEKDIAQVFVECGVISETDRPALERLVEKAVASNGGSIMSALSSLGVERAFEETFWEAARSPLSSTIRGETPAFKNARDRDISKSGLAETEGRYELTYIHASGGMGEVSLVYDKQLNRSVALKELKLRTRKGGDDSSKPPSPELVARFFSEAHVTSYLDHPSIVPVYEYGRRVDGTPYYTMKFIDGHTLEEAIEKAAPVEERLKLLPHFLDACFAIAYAHERGVLHRDIKPSNIIIGRFGETLVLDWGIAKVRGKKDIHADTLAESIGKVRDGADPDQTKYGEVLGTPGYMSPEQATGNIDDVDKQSDVYSLGVILYRILTGKLPYMPKTPTEFLRNFRVVVPPHPRAIEPRVPRELAAVCTRAIAREKANRYSSVEELADEIQRYQSGALVQAFQYSLLEKAAKRISQHKTVAVTAAIAFVALLGVGAISYMNVIASRDDAIAARQDMLEERQRARYGEYRSNVQLAATRVLDGNAHLAQEALDECAPEFRDWEWRHLAHALAPAIENGEEVESEELDAQDISSSRGSLQWSRYVHEASVGSVAFNPDGSSILTNALDGTARVIDAATGETRFTIEATSGALYMVAFSSGGNRIVTASNIDSTAAIWDADDGSLLTELDGHSAAVLFADLDPDGTRALTCSSDRTARLWDARTGETVHVLDAHDDWVVHGRFSKDGREIYTVCRDGQVRVWSLEDGTLIRTVASPFDQPLQQMLLAPDCDTVAAVTDRRSVLFWSISTERLVSNIPGTAEESVGTFDATGAYFVRPSGATIEIWEVHSGKRAAVVPSESGEIRSAVLDPDLIHLAGGDRSGNVHLWRMVTLDQSRDNLENAHTDTVIQVNFSPDSKKLLTASYDRSAALWDLETGELIDRSIEHDEELMLATFSSDGSKMYTVTWSMTGYTWNAGFGSEPIPFGDGFNTGMPRVFGGPRSGMSLGAAPTWTPLVRSDGAYALINTQGPAVQLWKLDPPALLRTVEVGRVPVGTWAFSPTEDHALTTTLDGSGLIWRLENGEEIARINGHAGAITTAAFDRAGKRLLTASLDRTARLWDASTGALIQTFQGHKGLLFTARFSPDEAYVVTASADASARLWALASGEAIAVLSGHTDAIVNAEFNPSGTRLMTSSQDGTVRIWDLEGQEMLTLPAGGDLVYACWSPDGKRIVAAMVDGAVRQWNTGK